MQLIRLFLLWNSYVSDLLVESYHNHFQVILQVHVFGRIEM